LTFAATPHRRLFVAAAGASLLAAPRAFAARTARTAEAELAALEAEIGGRVGVAAWDTGGGAWIRRRADERFAMASSFKVLLAGAVLEAIDGGEMAGDRPIRFSRADLLSYAPRTRARVDNGAMTVLELCAAAVEVSDNTAANLLLVQVGGPAGLTRRLRALGDPTTRLDRTELALNTNLPGDPRDTTTPEAFVRVLDRLLLRDALSGPSRRQLADWMIHCETGLTRLRAGLPSGWKAGDKTGTGERGAVNDVAIAWPPGRAPILVAALLDASSRPTDDLAAAHARIARIVVAAFG